MSKALRVVKTDELKPARPMTKNEARACVKKISADMDGVREAVFDLHERCGWEALGYQSWRECVTAEFPQSERRLYQELTAAKVEKVLNDSSGAARQSPVRLPETHARVLAKLKKPEEQVLAYTEAVALAPDGKPTAKILVEVVGPMLSAKKSREPKTNSKTTKAKPEAKPTAEPEPERKLEQTSTGLKWECKTCGCWWEPKVTECAECADPDDGAAVEPPSSPRAAPDDDDDESSWDATVASSQLFRTLTITIDGWPHEALDELDAALRQALQRVEKRKRKVSNG